MVFTLAIGAAAPDFRLPGVDGRTYSLADFKDAKVLIVVFSCNDCPFVVGSEDRMKKLVADYDGRGVKMIAVNSNETQNHPTDSFEHMKTHHREKALNFPYVRDDPQDVADAYGAMRTPHFYVFDSRRKLAYTGRMDDNPREPGKQTTHELCDALDAVLAGKTPKPAVTKPIGCRVKWKGRSLDEKHGFDSFEVWKQYESVAMHFNDLLMRLRSQSLAAVAAFGAVATVVVKSDINVQLRWKILAATCAVLAFFWLAIWILDFTYYNRLLKGAVEAILEIERQTMTSNRVDNLILSTKIEEAVAKKSHGAQPWQGCGRWVFYGIVFITLLASCYVSVRAAGGIYAVLNPGVEPSDQVPAIQPLLARVPKK